MNLKFPKAALCTAKTIQEACGNLLLPPLEGASSNTHKVISFSLVKGTRGYLEKIVHQINGAYDNGWYDASAVMIRRLIETLIIEAFEAHKIEHKIMCDGEFLYLRDLIARTLDEKSWNLGRTTKKALPKLKDVGDQSAHSRRFNAHRLDIDNLIPDLRIVSQELIYLAKLK